MAATGIAAVRAVTVNPGGAAVQVSPCDIQACSRAGSPRSRVPPGPPGAGARSTMVAPYSPEPVCATVPPRLVTSSWKP
jgi:hypothetical protein